MRVLTRSAVCPWTPETARGRVRRGIGLVLLGLTLAVVPPLEADPGPQAPWYRLTKDPLGRGGLYCEAAPIGPRGAMHNADVVGDRYLMEDVVEDGVVVETTMRGQLTWIRRFGYLALSDRWMTWYRTQERCARYLAELRTEAQQERQRRERYR